MKSWIWLPKKVEFYSSQDGLNYKLVKSISHKINDHTDESVIHQFNYKLNKPIVARYVKVKAINYGVCPDWHLGAGGTSWLFFDEILVN